MHATDLEAAAVASIVDPHINFAQHAFSVRCEVGHAGRARHIALLPKDLDVWSHLRHKQQEVESACQCSDRDQLVVASEVTGRCLHMAHLTCQCISVPRSSARGRQHQCTPLQGDNQASTIPTTQPVNAEAGRMMSLQRWRIGGFRVWHSYGGLMHGGKPSRHRPQLGVQCNLRRDSVTHFQQPPHLRTQLSNDLAQPSQGA